MAMFMLPIIETTKGWVEIEAATLEEARDIVENGNPFDYADPQWRSGYVDYSADNLVEIEEGSA
jgi:hypothetical protein